MPIIKYDVSASDPERAKGSAMSVPKRGIKVVKIDDIVHRKTGGKNDLEVTCHIHSGENKNYPYWDYISFSEAAVWKMDQFLLALGVADANGKRKGQFDTTKQKGKLVRVDTKVETDDQGDPVRSKIRAWLGPVTDEDDDSEDADMADDESDADAVDDEEEEAEAEEEEAGDDYDAWEVSDLRAELKDRGLDTKGPKSALAERLRTADAVGEEESSEADEDEYDDWDDGDLKSELDDRGLNSKGRRGTLIQRLRDDDAKGSAFTE